jgi:hypothetical protein
MKLPTSPDGGDVDSARSSYGIQLNFKTLRYKGESRTYFDSARAVRN